MVCASVLPAQDSSFNPAYPKREFKHGGKITSEYKVEDGTGKTFVELEPVFIEHTEAENTSLRLSVIYEHEGKSPVKPEHISLAFFTRYPECKIPDRPEITVSVDGEVLKFGFTFKSYREQPPDENGVALSFSEMEGGRCNEVVAMFISQKNYLKVVNAHDVEVQIGKFKFKLKESDLEAMRDLASRMAL